MDRKTTVAVGLSERSVSCPKCGMTFPIRPNAVKISCPVCNRTVSLVGSVAVLQR